MLNRKTLNLIRELTISEFKLKDQGTLLGFLWTLIYPLSMLIILYALFSKRLGAKIEHYEIYLLVGLIHWNFFGRATSEGMKSMVKKRELLQNIAVSKTCIVTSSVLAIFIAFLLELIILAAFLVFSGLYFSLSIFIYPFVVLIEVLLIMGITFLLACLNAYFKDIEYIWNILLRMGFFLTPIFYPIPMVISSPKMGMYLLNPMTQIMLFSRDILLFKKMPNLTNMVFVFLFVLAVFYIGYSIFKKLEDRFVEIL